MRSYVFRFMKTINYRIVNLSISPNNIKDGLIDKFNINIFIFRFLDLLIWKRGEMLWIKYTVHLAWRKWHTL